MLPTFIGIGAQRTGTGWLYRNLNAHPEIWLTPVKELHYFDALGKEDSLLIRFRSALWRRQCASRILRDCLPGSRGSIRWDIRYFFGRRSNDWYASLFRPGEHQIAGEITPSYSVLTMERVKQIHKLMPNVKIIFVMRSPIERAWSHAINRLVNKENRIPEELSQEEIIAHIDSAGSVQRTDYVQTIRIWESHFPPDQIFYAFYDDVIDRPVELLMDICTFLNVNPMSAREYESVPKRVKPKMGSRFEIPHEVRVYIAKKYYSNLIELSQRFGGHTERWLAEARSIIASVE